MHSIKSQTSNLALADVKVSNVSTSLFFSERESLCIVAAACLLTLMLVLRPASLLDISSKQETGVQNG